MYSKFCIILKFYNSFMQFAGYDLVSISTCFAFSVNCCSYSVSSTKLLSSMCLFSVCRWSSPLMWHNAFRFTCCARVFTTFNPRTNSYIQQCLIDIYSNISANGIELMDTLWLLELARCLLWELIFCIWKMPYITTIAQIS